MRVEHFRGLLADYVNAARADVIVKGLRVVSDFESEMSAALMNRSLSDVDTLFLMSDQKYSFVSSSLVKEVFFLGGDVAALVPEPVLRVMAEKRIKLATEVAMSVYRVLDKLEAYVHEGTWLPAGYRILSEERLIELLEKIRASLPEEVGRAKIIAKDHDRMMRVAQEKAQAIVDEAASKHEELVDQNEIVQRARAAADAVLREAEERAPGPRRAPIGTLADVLGRDGGAPFGRARRRAKGPRDARAPAASRGTAARGSGREEQAGGVRFADGRRGDRRPRIGLEELNRRVAPSPLPVLGKKVA